MKISRLHKCLPLLIAALFWAMPHSAEASSNDKADKVMAPPSLTLSARATGLQNTFYYYLTVKNVAGGFGDLATDLTVTADLPAGTTFVSANLGGTLSGSTVTWTINNLAGKNATISPTFTVTSASPTGTTHTLTTAAVNCSNCGGPSALSGSVSRTVGAASATIEVATDGDNATAAANLLTNADGSKSTHPNFPYKTFVAAMTQIWNNNRPNQTLKFRPGTYTDSQHDIQSTSKYINYTTSNSVSANLSGLTIDGQGAMLVGNESTNNFFRATSYNVTDITLKNLIYTKFRVASTGSMLFTNIDGLVIDNCYFLEEEKQTVLLIDTDNSKHVAVTVSNCVFSGNPTNTETTSSGAFEIGGYTSASYDNVYNVNDCLFTCNARNSDGGAVKLLANSKDGRRTTITFDNCTFRGNTSSTTGSGGAALYVGPGSSSSNPTSVNLMGCTFESNMLDGSTSALGGAIATGRTGLMIDGCTFDKNGALSGTPGLRGGAVGTASGTRLIIVNSTFTGNYATSSHGGVRANGSGLKLDNCTFTDNTDGAACNDAAFTNTTISGTSAPALDAAKAAETCVTYSNTFTITGNVFNDGDGYTDSQVDGGGIKSVDVGNIYVGLEDNADGNIKGYDLIDPVDGSFTISGVDTKLASATAVSNYKLVLSNVEPVIGATLTPSIPAGWEATGEHFGDPTNTGSDGTADKSLTSYDDLQRYGTTVDNLNFALNKIPVVGTETSDPQLTPAGTDNIAVQDLLTGTSDAIFSAEDLETPVTGIKLVSFPTGATSFRTGTTTYYPTAGDIPGTCPTTTCLEFPAGGVDLTTDAAGVPDDLSVDPSFTDAGSVVFTYTNRDAALAESPAGTATINFSGPLPVELKELKVKQEECHAVMTWTTASEENSAYFEVEASRNGQDFEMIGIVAAAGYSAEEQDYQWIDREFSGRTYYRLRMVDLDDTYEYSPVVELAPEGCGQGLTIGNVRPNPVKSHLHFSLNSSEDLDVSIVVTDMMGRVLRSLDFSAQAGNSILEMDLSGMPSGVYFLQAYSSEGIMAETVKFVKAGY